MCRGSILLRWPVKRSSGMTPCPGVAIFTRDPVRHVREPGSAIMNGNKVASELKIGLFNIEHLAAGEGERNRLRQVSKKGQY